MHTFAVVFLTMAIELTINHASVAEGGPTQILVIDGATTIARVVELFKEQTGATGTIRLRFLRGKCSA